MKNANKISSKVWNRKSDDTSPLSVGIISFNLNRLIKVAKQNQCKTRIFNSTNILKRLWHNAKNALN